MVDITPLVPAGRQLIQGYGDGAFRIAGTRHDGSVLVFPDRTLAWPVTVMEGLTAGSLAPVTAPDSGVELVLIGCGAAIAPLDAAAREALRARGIVHELMDTGAACRTFNVLLAEDRAVCAAMIAVD